MQIFQSRGTNNNNNNAHVPANAHSTLIQHSPRHVSLNSLTDKLGNDWCIKIRVTNVRGPSSYHNSRGHGVYMKFAIMDEAQSEMNMTVYGVKLCEQFKSMIHQNKVYEIEGGQIQRVNPRFKMYNTDFEITLNKRSIIRSCRDDSTIPLVTVNR